MRLRDKIKSNYMVTTFINLRGNPKACICTEPLWFIPYSLFIPFATIYMHKLGVTDYQIGIILSAGMLFQVFFALFGGLLTDKFGRRVTTIVSDAISWTIPCIIWAFAQNFWWFLIAALINSIYQVSNNSWASLLVEDCDKRVIVTVYSWIEICGLLAVFFAPISAFLVDNFDTVLVVRCLYGFSAISMSAKFILLFKFGRETEQGKIRMRETKNTSLFQLARGYKGVLIKLIHSKEMLLVLFVMLSYNVTNMVVQNFFGLYTTQNLFVSEKYLAVFPMVRAAIMITFMFTIQPKLNRLPFKPVMTAGFLMFSIAHLLLLFCPPHQWWMLIVYTFLEACSLACIVPRKEALGAIFIDQQERSRVFALLYTSMVALTVPFGWFVGLLSSIHRALPFVFNICIFVLSIIVIRSSKAISTLDKSNIHN